MFTIEGLLPSPIDPKDLCVVCHAQKKIFNDDRCEDCWAFDQWIYHGKSQSVNVNKIHTAMRATDKDTLYDNESHCSWKDIL